MAEAAPEPAVARRITRADVLTVVDVAALLDLKPYTVKEYAAPTLRSWARTPSRNPPPRTQDPARHT
jgi:hypothetical protein